MRTLLLTAALAAGIAAPAQADYLATAAHMATAKVACAFNVTSDDMAFLIDRASQETGLNEQEISEIVVNRALDQINALRTDETGRAYFCGFVAGFHEATVIADALTAGRK